MTNQQQEKLGYADYIDDCPAEARKKIEMLVNRYRVRRSNKLVDRPNGHDGKNGEPQNKQSGGDSS